MQADDNPNCPPGPDREERTIFFSWATGPDTEYLRAALEQAVILLNARGAAHYTLDEATREVPGAPNIVTSLCDKIEKAFVFVADVSIVGSIQGRSFPNPNVCYELGYAIKALGDSRTILLFNSKYKIQDLPFDFNQRRVSPFVKSSTPAQRLHKELMSFLKDAKAPPNEEEKALADSLLQLTKQRKQDAEDQTLALAQQLAQYIELIEAGKTPTFEQGLLAKAAEEQRQRETAKRQEREEEVFLLDKVKVCVKIEMAACPFSPTPMEEWLEEHGARALALGFDAVWSGTTTYRHTLTKYLEAFKANPSGLNFFWAPSAPENLM